MNKPQSTVDAVVERLTDLAPPGWIRLVLNWEVTPDEDDDLMAGMAIFAVVRDGTELRRSEIDYDWTLGQCIDCLYWLMAEVNDRRWTTMHLEVDVDGDRRVGFEYDRPAPLGSIDHRFDDYIEKHRAELDALAEAVQVGESGGAASMSPSPGTPQPAGLDEQQELIQTIVQRFAAIAPDGWARLAGNWEAYRDDDGRLTLNYITVAIVNGGHEWLYGQVGYDHVLYDAVIELNERMAGGDEQRRWTVFDLEVDADPPEFRVDFGYGTPKRVNGIDDHESIGRFRDYLQTWIDAHGPTP
ncbi:hypothetical protein [Haloactinopolyspora sp.]|uniref:hypothetical protein n=1 Tax=Haloactinopolyspora sp. TaxID=1966353 RepID=UPI00260EA551|nr:hypothetical protein [Haloactinopolyspora sp.]